MVVKRFISIALAGLLAIGSINTGSVRAYAADEDLLLEEASFEDSGEELLEEEPEEVTEEIDDAIGGITIEDAEEVVEEEPVVGEEGEEDGAFAATSAPVTKVKVNINYYVDGKTKAVASDSNIEVTLAEGKKIALKAPSDFTPTLDKPYYEEAWTLKDSISGVSIPTTGDDKGKLVIAANTALTDGKDINVKIGYTPYTYTVEYYSNLGDKVTFPAATYKTTYTYAGNDFFIFPAAPAKDFYTAGWFNATNVVAASGDTPASASKGDTEYEIDEDLEAYTVPIPNTNNAKVQLFANYTPNELTPHFINTIDDSEWDTWEDSAPDFSSVDADFPAEGHLRKIILPTIDVTDYEFGGWFTDEECSNSGKITPVTEGEETTYPYTENAHDGDVYFYAKFTADSYGATYAKGVVADNSPLESEISIPSGLPQTLAIDAEVKLDPATTTNNAWKFKAWSIKGANLTADEDGKFDYTVTKTDLTGSDTKAFAFTAVWEKKAYDIKYVLEGGNFVDGYDAKTTYNLGDTIYLLNAKVEKDDYHVKAWKVGSTEITTKLTAEEATALDNGTSEGDFYYEVKNSDIEGLTFTVVWEKDDSEAKEAPITYKHINSKTGAEITADVDNDVNQKVVVIKGNAVTPITLNAISCDGYTFDGWFLDEALTDKVLGDPQVYTIPAQEDARKEAESGLTFYAKWIPASATATLQYDTNGGYVVTRDSNSVPTITTDNTISDATVEIGTAFTEDLLPELTMEGYTFDGWFLDPECTEAIVAGTTLFDKAGTIYAGFTQIEYAFTFKYGSAEVVKTYLWPDDTGTIFKRVFKSNVVSIDDQNKITMWKPVTSGMPVLDANLPTTAGLDDFDAFISEFEGSSATSKLAARKDAKVAVSYVASTFDPSAETFKVKYNANINFDFDEDDFVNSEFVVTDKEDLIQYVEYTVGTAVTITGREFVRYGYTLQGWQINGTGTTYKAGAKLPTTAVADQVIELKAVWKKDAAYKITSNLRGGKLASGVKIAKTYTYDSPYTLPTKDQISKKGYVFNGWSTSDTATVGYATRLGKNGYYYTGDITLYATWKPVEYFVKFDTDGGSIISNQTVEYGEALALNKFVPTKNGYKFKNWTVTVGGKKKTYKSNGKIKNLTTVDQTTFILTANWTPVSYSITYDNKGGSQPKTTAKKYTPGLYDSEGKTGAEAISIELPSKPGYTFNRYTLTMKGGKADGTDATAILKEVKGDDGKLKGYTLTKGDYGNVVLTADFTPTVFTVKIIDETKTGDTGTTLAETYASGTSIDLAKIANDMTLADTTKSIKGFGVEAGKVKYGFASAKIVDIAKAAGKINATGADAVITLYAVPEAAKSFAYVTVKYNPLNAEGATEEKTISTAYTFAAKDGKSIKLPTVKGFAYKAENKWSSNAAESEYSVDAKGNITVKSANAAKKMTFDVTLQPVEYKVMLMPNATGVKYGTTAVNKKTGVQYGTEKIKYNTTATLEGVTLSRTGYEFVGFGTSAKTKADKANAKLSLAALSYDKKGVAKVYAIWKVNSVEISYDPWADVSNAEDDIQIYNLTANYKNATYGKKFTLPKPKVTGYNFVGWQLVGSNKNVKTKVDKKTKATIVSSIAKNNTEPIKLKALFTEKTYNITINANGGKFSGKKTYKKIRYSEDISKIVAEVRSSKMTKKGYTVGNVTLAKINPKKYNEKQWIGYYWNDGGYRLYSTKKVTLYPYWVSATSETSTTYVRAEFDGTTLNVNSNMTGSSRFITQYSEDSAFAYDVHEVIEAGNYSYGTYYYNAITKSVAPAAQYYVRIATYKTSSDGKPIIGAWSKVVTAKAAANPDATVNIKYYSKDTSEATPKYTEITSGITSSNKTVMAFAGEPVSTIKQMISVPANYTLSGDLYTADTFADDKKVQATDKVTNGMTLYVVATAVTKKYKVHYDMGTINNSYGPNIDMSKIVGKKADVNVPDSKKFTADMLPDYKTDTYKDYGFVGWFDADAGTEVKADTAIADGSDVWVEARWTPLTYSIKFEAGTGATGGNTITVNRGATVYLDQDLGNLTAPAGKVFDHWEYKVSETSTKKYQETDSVKNLVDAAGTATLTAVWRDAGKSTLKVYRIVDNGANTVTDKKPLTGTFDEDKDLEDAAYDVISANNAWPVGATAYGVRYYPNGSKELSYIPSGSVVADIGTVYVKFEPDRYVVKYDANGGTGSGTIDDQENVSFATVTDKAAANVWTRAGYEFAGWCTVQTPNDDNPGKMIQPGEYLSGLDSDWDDTYGTYGASVVTLYAQWKGNEYKVIYYPNGAKKADGTTAAEPVTLTMKYGEGTKVLAVDDEKIGFKYPLKTCTDLKAVVSGAAAEVVTAGTDTFDSLATAAGRTVKIYPTWADNYWTVTFDLKGGKIGTSTDNVVIKVEKDSLYSAITKPVPTKDGYTLAGWKNHTDSTAYPTGATVKVENDAIYDADWSEHQVTITFDGNGAAGSTSSQTIKYTDDPKTLASNNFTVPEGKAFGGWGLTDDAEVADKVTDADISDWITSPTATKTLYAIWVDAD